MKVTVGDLMTRDVQCVRPDASFREMAALMREHHVSALPVTTNHGRLVGLVSEADLLLKEELNELKERRLLESRSRRTERDKASGRTAREIMTRRVVTAWPTMPARDAARLMHERRVKRLPVVDPLDRVVGIISRSDLLKVFNRSDGEIRREIVEGLIVGTMWMDPGPVDVEVTDGVVRLSGEVDRRTDKRLLCSLAAEVAGVVGVQDGLTYRYDDSRLVSFR